jgi:hypothetical protein
MKLALNPDQFTGCCTDEDILSTLAHEMAHVWQQTHGKPPTTPEGKQGKQRKAKKASKTKFTCPECGQNA